LRIAVVNEPELAQSMNRLRGEWAERSGGELRVSTIAWSELADEKAVDADLVAFPSRYLGELCVRNWLRPVRSNVLESDELDALDFFPVVRHELISWGGKVMALPLGIDPTAIGKGTERLPAIVLIERAAPAAMSKESLGVFFDSESMRPRIAEPPFVEALTGLVKSHRAAEEVDSVDVSVPVLGYADRLVSVTSTSRNAATAFRLLEWFALPDISSQLARAGQGVLPVRRSLASSPVWYGSNVSPSERSNLSDAVSKALSQPAVLMIPQIPGVDEYMAALNDAAGAAVHADLPPQQALEEAAKKWEQITDSHGRDRQQMAYLKRLGLADP
jgi:hypothetical protein